MQPQAQWYIHKRQNETAAGQKQRLTYLRSFPTISVRSGRPSSSFLYLDIFVQRRTIGKINEV